MSAKQDRLAAERHAAVKQRQVNDGLEAIRTAGTLVEAIATALALHDAIAPTLPIGGGFAVPGAAIDHANFIVDALIATGWTTRSTP